MSVRRQYFVIENLGLNATQRNTLVQALQGIGQADQADSPAWRVHWRVRLDNDAAIFEAVFDDNDLTVAAIKARLASIFGVAVGSISSSTGSQSFGGGTTTVVTFTYSAVQRLRVALFGGAGASIEQSRAEAQGYLVVNSAAWESVVGG